MRAAEREPTSRVFREWRSLASDTGGPPGARVHKHMHMHMHMHMLSARLRPDG